MEQITQPISKRTLWQAGACLALGVLLQAGCATWTPAPPAELALFKEVQIGPEASSVVQLSFEALRPEVGEPAAEGRGDAEPAAEASTAAKGDTVTAVKAAAGSPHAGHVVLMRDGEEMQRIEHDFGEGSQHLLGAGWVRLEDLSGDGWMELVLPRQESDGGLSDVVYAYHAQRQRYERVTALSDRGTVRGLAPGCVLLETDNASQTLCHLPAARRWVRLYAPATAAQAGADVGQLEATCVGPGSRLTDCRQLRLQTDRSLQSALAALKQQQREQVQQAHGRPTATRVLANLDAGHRAWLNYRDNRCMGHAREQGLAGAGLQMVFESCRYQMALQQTVEYGQP